MSEERLKRVAEVIAAKRVSMTLEDARELAKRAKRFKAEKGRLPSLTAADAWEKRMAEGIAFLQRKVEGGAAMAEHVTDEDLELLGELGVDTAPAASGGRSAKEQRIIAGFEEIERFVEEHGTGARSMARIATSSSGFTRCDWIECGNPRSAARS